MRRIPPEGWPAALEVPLSRPCSACGGAIYLSLMQSLAELRAVYDQPLPELILRAAEVHRAHHDFRDIQRCALLSIKTGGCPEDCAYCAQSARYQTGVPATPLLSVAEVKERAAQAKRLGATRFCMGA